MKCKKCKREMQRRTDVKNIFYFYCPNCGNEVGKQEEKKEDTKNDKD